jgi:hypothetical protein
MHLFWLADVTPEPLASPPRKVRSVPYAVLATVPAGRTSELAAGGARTLAALNGGYHLASWVAAALAATAIPVAAAILRPAG